MMSAACSIDTIRGSHLPRCDLVKYVDASGFLEFESGSVGCNRMPPVPCQPPFCLSLTSPCMRLCVCYAGAPLCVLLSLQPCETCGVLTSRFAIVVICDFIQNTHTMHRYTMHGENVTTLARRPTPARRHGYVPSHVKAAEASKNL